MTPIERVVRNVADFLMNACGSFLDFFNELGPIQIGLIVVVVLGIAALCLKGNPVRGA